MLIKCKKLKDSEACGLAYSPGHTDGQKDGQHYTIKSPPRDWRIKIFFSQTLVILCYAVHAATKKKINRKFNENFQL